MDPNLTLAHITHNTSMILLHEQIAYPTSLWNNTIRTPSAHSSETCQNAAAETATITRKYLKYTPDNSPVNSQFAFCVFVSARTLLVHWRVFKICLGSHFWVLVESLDEFAKRWAGLRSKSKSSLAARYSAQLREMHRKCLEDPHYYPDIVYSTDGFATQTSNDVEQQQTESRQSRQHRIGSIASILQSTFDSASQSVQATVNPTTSQAPGNQPRFISPLSSPNPEVEPDLPDGLSTISTVLMDQDFMQLDRVISFDDMMFTAQTTDDQVVPFSMPNWTLG
ncbi:hypothetical protein IL306_011510 [Fusarium sp. DS 682]|nr:hypothetical protein IL306_011510 [Fusarium sp. DS 682]